MFEIIFLGTSSATPTVERGLPSIAIRKEGKIILFDCGEGTQRQMMKFGVSYMKVDAIFISHLHLDHFLGLFGLIETMALHKREKPLEVFVPEGFKFFNKKPFLKITHIKDKDVFEFGNFSVSVFKNNHAQPSFAFLIKENDKIKFFEKKAKSLGIKGPLFSQILKEGELLIGKKKIKLKDVTYVQPGKKIVYSGDTAFLDEMIKIAKDADLLIHEATFCSDREEEAKNTLHSSAKQVAQLAKKAKVKKLVLTHLSGRYSDPELFLSDAKQFKNTIVAKDGLKFVL
jgi:ribonuclease Z